MTNLLVLFAGILLSIALLIFHSGKAGVAALVLTSFAVIIVGIRNRKRFLQDPEKMKELDRRRRQLEKKLGLNPLYVDIEDGLDATGKILDVSDKMGAHEDNRTLEIVLRVTQDAGESFDVTLERNVPMLLLPQFQVGREFTLRIDRTVKDEISFESYSTDDGQVVSLAKYNAF